MTQKEMNEAFSKEMDKVTLSWDEDLRYVHEIAMRALKVCSLANLNVEPTFYDELSATDKHGVKANVVYVLMKAIEICSPNDLQMSVQGYGLILMAVHRVGKSWNALATPIQKSIATKAKLININ